MNLPSENLEMHVANSIDFMVERVSHRHLYSPYCHVASFPGTAQKIEMGLVTLPCNTVHIIKCMLYMCCFKSRQIVLIRTPVSADSGFGSLSQ